MADLQKLLVIVPSGDRCSEFRAKYITPPEGTTRQTTYDNKIVFLQDKLELFTQGNIYSSSGDITDIKAILAGFGTGEGSNYTTVQNAIDAVIQSLNGSGLINISRDGATVTTTDTVSLTYTNGSIQLGSWDANTSTYSVIGQSLPVADTGAKVADEVNTYVAATTYAIRQYLSSELGDIANALTFEGDSTYMKAKLDGSDAVKKDVGNLYVMETAYTLTFDGKTYELAAGDSVIIKSVDTSTHKVTGITTVNRALTGEVTTSSQVLTANKVILGADNQTIKTSEFSLGTDIDTISASSATYTLATEKAVGTAIKVVSDQIAGLDANYTYTAAHTTGNYVSYSYIQTDGLVSGVSIEVDQATVTYTAGSGVAGTIEVSGNGFIDNNAASAIISYVTGKVEELDESFTTVSSADSTYITVTYSTTGNDYAYTVGANIVRLGEAVGMTYDTQTGQWVPGSGNIQHGLADAADIAQELVADEEVIASVLNNHEERIQDLEEATGGIAISSTYTDQLSVTYSGLTYTLTTNTAAVSQSSNALVTGAQVYSYVGGAIGGLDVTTYEVSATGSTSVTGYIAFSYTETDGIVNISGLSYQAAYVSVADNLVAYLDRDGLVTGQLLADVINALNPWEEYAGEPEPVQP